MSHNYKNYLDVSMSMKKQHSSLDQRSRSMNPNDTVGKAAAANHAKQVGNGTSEPRTNTSKKK